MRVYLRAFEIDDYKISTKWRNDYEVTKSLIGPRYFVSSLKEKEWIQNAIQNLKDSIKLATKACPKIFFLLLGVL